MTLPAHPNLLLLSWSLGLSVPSVDRAGLPWALPRLSLSSCPVSTDRSGTTGERQRCLLLAVRPSPAEGTRSWSFLPGPSHMCPEDPQASFNSVEGMGASSSASNPHCPLPELGWFRLEKFQGRQRQPAWQTNSVWKPPQERLKDFILIPKLLAWRGAHKSERDFVVVSSDVSFLLAGWQPFLSGFSFSASWRWEDRKLDWRVRNGGWQAVGKHF